jgi:hypothetical protein
LQVEFFSLKHFQRSLLIRKLHEGESLRAASLILDQVDLFNEIALTIAVHVDQEVSEHFFTYPEAQIGDV